MKNTVVGHHCTTWQQGEVVQLLGVSLRVSLRDRAWGEAPFLPFGPCSTHVVPTMLLIKVVDGKDYIISCGKMYEKILLS